MNNNNNYQAEFTAIIKQAQRDIINKAIEAILDRNDQIIKVLENGQGIYEQAIGDRFIRMEAQCRMLRIKIYENLKTICTLHDIEKNVFNN